ncbi:bifunctional aminoglycoside phosphotransferase/ATP-binding protein [Hydrogenophaga sp. PAMC20947]|uniref:bifunctional aminoglycoside phosphotransferase/ATP-binding protein n=1 Tax=Hydrogenophaga sp. PAMC20947 TaxID=2565558 RepID=UPI00109D8FA5|nr:bifunctional aminoglycoside phosphotransferase/ATP-binding protein [Hydrogenophaga sp. PAMC20947]QCB48339.1 hypothetical protein E5678_21315 [Hydrogenophaga sp. PAMC20947]
MVDSLPPLIQALLSADRYAHPVGNVSVIETHGAWVLLAGEFAYKIKKPVHFPFMDFSTLNARRRACETEVRVNRRFQTHDRPATQLYLGVLPLFGTPDQPRWGSLGTQGEGEDQAFEFAVQMRRFDESQRLDHLCERGALTPDHIRSLARRMAAFQTRAAVADPAKRWGHPAAAMRWPRDNFQTLAASLPSETDAALVRQLRDWTDESFGSIEPLLSRRRQKDRVREGHGDLHLANLVLIDGEVLPFDGIEFNDELRWIDVANDMAFAWMDLLHQQQPGLANLLLSEWLDASGDVSAPAVWGFFASYRAGVRAKIAAIRLGQLGGEGRSPEADASLVQARRYLELARDISRPPPPQLIITHGLSGSGKTWASGRWLQAEASGRAIRLRSDVERKRLHGMNALAPTGSEMNAGLYSAQSHGDTYASLLARARNLIHDGWSVLIDAAFLRVAERQAFAALAQAAQCPFHILAPSAPIDVLRARITARQAQGHDASEATVAVLEQQLGWLEPLTETERAACLPTLN